jgi:hypothetical protein
MRQKVVRNKPVKPLTRLQTEKMQEKKKRFNISLLKRLGAKLQDLVGVSICLGNWSQKRTYHINPTTTTELALARAMRLEAK